MPRRLDLAVALALTGLVLLEAAAGNLETPSPPVAGLLGALIALPLAWRTRFPLAACVASAAAFGALGLVTADLGQSPQTILLPYLLAAFTAGAHPHRGRAIGALAAIMLGHVLAEAEDLIVLGPVFAGVWFAGRLVETGRRRASSLAERASALEHDRSEHARLAIAEERARIARELHDVVAHSVSVMVVQAGAERLALGEERPQTREVLGTIERTGRHALAEMRRLVGMLRDDDEEIALAPLPTLDRLGALAEHVSRAGLPVRVEVTGERRELPPGIDVSGYRIVQEALTNALKHAGPAQAVVRLRYEPSGLEIEVADDGRGGTADGTSGHGLAGMRERVAVYGGEIEAGTVNGTGFRVRARLPTGGAA